jgi:hypothetical protein
LERTYIDLPGKLMIDYLQLQMFEERIGARQFSSFDTSVLMDETRKQHDSSEPLPMSVDEDDKKVLAVEEHHIESI